METDHPQFTPASLHNDESGHVLPSVDVLIAGTLALMTGYAQAAPECPNRTLMAKKLISNLFFLANHPNVTPTMCCMLCNLRTRWQMSLEETHCLREPAAPKASWHEAPGTVQ